MTSRNHNNRSEKMKGHTPIGQEQCAQDRNPAQQGHQGNTTGGQVSRAGADRRNDGKSSHNGGGDGAGGAPKHQGQGQANKGVDNQHQNRGHG